MWQQSDCNIANATRHNPSGCLNDLYPFVINTYTNIPDPFSGGAIDDNGGGNSMAFYNVQAGDAPVLKSLADQFSMSDNFHQSVMGGAGANHVMLGLGDAIFWSDGKGAPTTPPGGVIANRTNCWPQCMSRSTIPPCGRIGPDRAGADGVGADGVGAGGPGQRRRAWSSRGRGGCRATPRLSSVPPGSTLHSWPLLHDQQRLTRLLAGRHD